VPNLQVLFYKRCCSSLTRPVVDDFVKSIHLSHVDFVPGDFATTKLLVVRGWVPIDCDARFSAEHFISGGYFWYLGLARQRSQQIVAVLSPSNRVLSSEPYSVDLACLELVIVEIKHVVRRGAIIV
jgi:hypothetical protein